MESQPEQFPNPQLSNEPQSQNAPSPSRYTQCTDFPRENVTNLPSRQQQEQEFQQQLERRIVQQPEQFQQQPERIRQLQEEFQQQPERFQQQIERIRQLQEQVRQQLQQQQVQIPQQQLF